MASNKIKDTDQFVFYGPKPGYRYKESILWGPMKWSVYGSLDENDCVKWRTMLSKLMTTMYGE